MLRRSNVHSNNSHTSHSSKHQSTSINLHGQGYGSYPNNAAPRPAVVSTTSASETPGQYVNLFPTTSASTNASSTVLSYKQAAKGGGTITTGSSSNYYNAGGSLASHSHSHSHSMSNYDPAHVPLPINTASLKQEHDEDHHLGFVSLKKASNSTVRRTCNTTSNSNINHSEGNRPTGEFNWTLD